MLSKGYKTLSINHLCDLESHSIRKRKLQKEKRKSLSQKKMTKEKKKKIEVVNMTKNKEPKEVHLNVCSIN